MPYKGPKDKKVRGQVLVPGLASMAELEAIRQVPTLRKSSAQYLLPKSYVEKLSQRPEIVRAYVRRGTKTSVSPRTLVENLDRLCIQVNEYASMVGSSADVLEEDEMHTSLQDDSCDAFSEPCRSEQQLMQTACGLDQPFESSGFGAPSLSRRRLAANKPTLDHQLLLPPAPRFDGLRRMDARYSPAATTSPSDSPPVIRRSKTSLAKLLIGEPPAGSSEIPTTPVDQIAREKHTPPDAPRQGVSKSRRTSLLTSLLSTNSQDGNAEVTSPYPFTPLNDNSIVMSTTPLQETPSQTPISEAPNDTRTFASVPGPSRSPNLPVSGRAAPSFRASGHLSFHNLELSTPSPLSLDHVQPPHDLASPMTLRTPHFPALARVASTLHSPAIRVGSPGYFNV